MSRDDEQLYMQMARVVSKSDHDALCTILGMLAGLEGKVPERHRRLIVKAVAVKLAAKVNDVGFVVE
jgi:hypothetical protein